MTAEYDDKELWTRPEGYLNAHHTRYSHPIQVPLTAATPDSLSGLGTLVTDFDSEKVCLETWPQTGSRQIIAGTGRGGGTLHEEFRVFWDGDLARVEEIPPDPSEQLVAGRLPGNVSPGNRTHVLVRDFTYHPDGGQVFSPSKAEPFVQVFAPPGDDVTPRDMRAFYFDGSFGVQIHPKVWHQFPYPVGEELSFRNKQSAVFACVMVDFVKEFSTYLSVPLTLR